MHSLQDEQSSQDSFLSSVCIHTGIPSQYQSCNATCGLKLGRKFLLIEPCGTQLVPGLVMMQCHANFLASSLVHQLIGSFKSAQCSVCVYMYVDALTHCF